ncbi:hypothetical protein LEL_09060 [Akanthomyces lecanii RCEF 1005]|uniref:MARVEL-like domain protein n=1 Tax=Akanthomyces lecanii RCEF 1005 TaxID=1081108 RepID=A0A168CV38_CORDF|nr:hypothetical protein LEL_09060 [Akanthomyces lecanii RCEF 1005]
MPYASQITRFIWPQYKLHLHVVQILLTTVIMILAIIKLATLTRTAPRTRSDTIALGMGAKSLVIILYQVCAEHVARLRKCHSYKANLILNSLEIVFWAAVAFLTMQANLKSCSGIGCGVGWAIFVMAIFQSMLASYAAMISFVDYRRFRYQPKASDVSP